MPKPRQLFHVSMVVDALLLHAVTTAAAAGKAFDLKIEPVIDKRAAAETDDSAEPRIPAKTFLIPWCAKQKQFSIKDAIRLGAEHGLSKGAIYTAVLTAQKDGWLQRTGPGSYKVLAAIKQALKALNNANGGSTHGNAKSQRTASPQRQRNDVVHTDFILGLINRGNAKYVSLKDEFVQAGRAPRSIDGALAKLKASKMIATVALGEYKILAKGSEHLKSLTT
jgi:hypothetical protein